MKTKRSLLLAVLALACVAVAVQDQDKGVLLVDKNGNFKIYDAPSSLFDLLENGDISFKAEGSPMRGFSKQQGLTFSAKKMEGYAKRTSDGNLRLQNGTATGDVVMDVKSSVEAAQTTTSSHIETQSLKMTETDTGTTVVFPGPFLFNNSLTTTNLERTIQLKAPSGTFLLPVLDQTAGMKNPFLHADVKGPVDVLVVSKTKTDKGTSQWTVHVVCDSVTYDASDRTLRLLGNVKGDVTTQPATGEPFGFDVNVDWITILLDDNMMWKDVRMGKGGVQSKGGGQ